MIGGFITVKEATEKGILMRGQYRQCVVMEEYKML